jgi:hypothetical protein
MQIKGLQNSRKPFSEIAKTKSSVSNHSLSIKRTYSHKRDSRINNGMSSAIHLRVVVDLREAL